MILQKRDIGIDIMKFFAVLLIMNSHADIMYAKYPSLATGGTIGNVMFFFCSGFTLFLKPMTGLGGFTDWYKRRLNRILPTLLAFLIFGFAVISPCRVFFFGEGVVLINDFIDFKSFFHIFVDNGWFITCILAYYVLIYFLGSYFNKHLTILLIVYFVLVIVWFFVTPHPANYDLYNNHAGGGITWIMWFMYMLLGALAGSGRLKSNTSSVTSFVLVLLSIALFYGLYIYSKTPNRIWLQVFSLIPLFGVGYFSHRLFNGQLFRRIYKNSVGHAIIRVIGGLCLETYLVHFYVFNDLLNNIFPANIVILFVASFIMAYFLRCLARFISQTFNDKPYDWKSIFSVY